MNILRFFEPEETVGDIWHGIAGRIGAEQANPRAAVRLTDLKASLAVLFRALGGAHGVEIVEAAAVRVRHKRRLRRRLSHATEVAARPSFDGDRLRLPAAIADFETATLNRAAYLWLTATAAVGWPSSGDSLPASAEPGESDRACLLLNQAASGAVLEVCPGLRGRFGMLCRHALERRPGFAGSATGIERSIRAILAGGAVEADELPAIRQATRVAPVPFWLDFESPGSEASAADDEDPGSSRAPSVSAGAPRQGRRRELAESNRKDSFIVHRFETILSWVESMDINRTVEDDDEDNAKKAAEDQDSVTLTRHDRKTASRLHLHLDLSPAEAEHERVAGKYVYPEWNHRKQAYMADHCRVLEADAAVPGDAAFRPDRHSAERVRRQFEVLRTRRMLETRQTDGNELDLDALIAARADLLASGRGSDRIYIASRKSQRDLSVALLLDTSRSTEADMDGTCVIDVARHALTALAHGLDACGDRFGIWSFSSLRRKRVFLTRCKGFESPMSERVDRRIAALQPGHYTRMGAAIRHVSMRLARQPSAQKLLLILTDGKPNDVDHYEGQHGVEDSRMAVREARRQGLVVHGVVVDEDGQDWFARIFERSGFTLLPSPGRLITALPEIYRSLTQEF